MIEGCEDRGIKYIGVRHEMTAAFMAEGWALATGQVGVCTATAGPGFTNLITGLANSDRGGIPVLCLAGKARVTENDRNALQDFNQIDLIKQMTKHARVVLEAQRIPEYGEGYFLCRYRQTGAGISGNPRDIMEAKVDSAQWNFRIFTGLQALRWAVRKTYRRLWN